MEDQSKSEYHGALISTAKNEGRNESLQFKEDNYQTKFVKEAFAPLSDSEKDVVLAEILKLIIYQGDPTSIRTRNATIRSIMQMNKARINIKGDIYEGEVIDGVANGKGVVKLADGGKFEGEFRGGVRRGPGVAILDSNHVIDTHYNRNGQAEGPGFITSGKEKIISQMFYLQGVSFGPSFTIHQDQYIFDRLIEDKRNGPLVRIQKNFSAVIYQEYKNDVPIIEPKIFIKSDVSNPEKENEEVQNKPVG